jgi:general secretion pathway protein G
MVELIAVLVILGLLAGMVLTNFTGYVDKARVKTTQASLRKLHSAVQTFKMDTGQYPSEEDGLWALIEEPMDVSNWQPGGYLETSEVPKDGWNNDFVYQLNPESGKPFVIISYGADGEPEGEDYNADIYSTDVFD